MKVGLDVGSTTIKCVVLDDADNHGIQYIRAAFQPYSGKVGGAAAPGGGAVRARRKADLAISGSAGMGMAESVQVPFVQEVFATRVAANKLAPGTDCHHRAGR